MAAEKRRMGGMKLSDFGSRSDSPVVEPEQQAAKPPVAEVVEKPVETKVAAKPKQSKPSQKQERLVTVNIKIKQSQQDWLADTARQVRQNNTEAVPAGDRVYPQHLIQAAIYLLQSADVDWAEVRNIRELKEQLNL